MGAICKHCNQDMLVAEGCANNVILYPDKLRVYPIPYNHEDEGIDDRCHDCGCMIGEIHHPGCDMEVCPRCSGQLISCGCLDIGANKVSDERGITKADRDFVRRRQIEEQIKARVEREQSSSITRFLVERQKARKKK